MEIYLLSIFSEDMFERFSVFGFIFGGIITLLATILIIILGLIPPAVIIWLVIFIFKKVNKNSEKRREEKHKKFLEKQYEKELYEQKKQFKNAKKDFIKYFPENLPECARAMVKINKLYSSGYTEVLDFVTEAEKMFDEHQKDIKVAGSRKNAVFSSYPIYKYQMGLFCTLSNEKEAIEWFLVGAEQGDLDCIRKCAEIYEGKDNKKSMYWYEKAAESGNESDIISLAYNYLLGEICEKDYIKAAELFKKAGENGNPESYHFAAVCYSSYAFEYAERNGIKEGDKVKWDSPLIKYSNLAEKYEDMAKRNGYDPEE